MRETTVTLSVTDENDDPIPDYSFTIKALVRPNSGGHDHTANRPTGKFITPAGDTVASFEGITASDGKAVYTYLSSGIGGVDSIFVRGATPEATASARIVLRRGDFELLMDGDHYDLIGAFGEPGVKSRHKVNHYGTSNFLTKLKALADSVHADSSFILRINDISLVGGGSFDTKNNWMQPHLAHRNGRNADIDDKDGNGKTVLEKYLEGWFKKPMFKGGLIDEKTHFHVSF